jgi:hypothetical protein
MPDRTACPRCETTGFVRSERVISGKISVIEYYCGRCHHRWAAKDDRNSLGNPSDGTLNSRRDA